MKRKGFTLIEIVSAIVIVGIIALITVPVTIRLINEAKKRSFLITAEGIVKATSLSLAKNEEKYDEYFKENEYITFKFSKSEGKEGESIDSINGEKIKLSFEGKSPIGGEVNLYKNGDIEVINLTDGIFYVNKDVDTELSVTENTGSLTRKELQTLVENLQKELEDVKEKNKMQDAKDQELEEKNTEQDALIKENTDNIATNTTNITNLTTTVNNINKNMLAKTYPVGSIYISTSSTNPSTIFGGTWAAFGAGRTLVGINTSDTNFNTVSKTGGAKTVNLQHSHTVNSHTHTGPSHTHSTGNHTLTIAEMPSHRHLQTIYWGNDNGTAYVNAGWDHGTKYEVYDKYTDYAGGGQPHNHGNTGASGTGATGSASPGTNNALSTAVSNLQPYITVYMWKRTA